MSTIRKALKPDELEKVNGGNIFEDIYCFFEGHGYNSVGIVQPDGADYRIIKYKCITCGQIIYEKSFPDGNTAPSSKSEYESV